MSWAGQVLGLVDKKKLTFRCLWYVLLELLYLILDLICNFDIKDVSRDPYYIKNGLQSTQQDIASDSYVQ